MQPKSPEQLHSSSPSMKALSRSKKTINHLREILTLSRIERHGIKLDKETRAWDLDTQSDKESKINSCREAIENWTCTSEHIDAIIPRLKLLIPGESAPYEKDFIEIAVKHPHIGKLLLHRIHEMWFDGDDNWIDSILGIQFDETESHIDFEKLHRIYPNDTFRERYSKDSTQTYYSDIRSMTKCLHLTANDTLYDLGSWYGRVLIYAAVNSPAQCKGIEIVPERVASCQAVRGRLQLDNLNFMTGNVLQQDYSDGNIFFLFNPFSRETLEAVGEQLKKLAEHKKIKIASRGSSTNYFHYQPRLQRIASEARKLGRIDLFESI